MVSVGVEPDNEHSLRKGSLDVSYYAWTLRKVWLFACFVLLMLLLLLLSLSNCVIYQLIL